MVIIFVTMFLFLWEQRDNLARSGTCASFSRHSVGPALWQLQPLWKNIFSMDRLLEIIYGNRKPVSCDHKRGRWLLQIASNKSSQLMRKTKIIKIFNTTGIQWIQKCDTVNIKTDFQTRNFLRVRTKKKACTSMPNLRIYDFPDRRCNHHIGG